MVSRITNESEQIAKKMVELMRLLNSVSSDLQIEIDKETGISCVYDLGAFGASPDMPDEIARMYLADSVGALIADSR